jgi:hypothetical protein
VKLEQEKKQPVEYISFSGIKDWQFCPRYYKITRIEKLYKFEGNIHTAFGTAMHWVLESMFLDRPHKDKMDIIHEAQSTFERVFDEELSKVGLRGDQNDAEQMREQAAPIIEQAIGAVENHFGKDFELISTEEQIDLSLSDEDLSSYDFKGIVDLTIRTPDGKYHVIDWKTCSWGWNHKKKADPMVTYQLTYYKHFLAKKHKIDLNDIETYFILLKRVSKKDHVEIMRVSSGPRKIENAMNLLRLAVSNIDGGNFIKKKTSCRNCAVWKTLCDG